MVILSTGLEKLNYSLIYCLFTNWFYSEAISLLSFLFLVSADFGNLDQFTGVQAEEVLAELVKTKARRDHGRRPQVIERYAPVESANDSVLFIHVDNCFVDSHFSVLERKVGVKKKFIRFKIQST